MKYLLSALLLLTLSPILGNAQTKVEPQEKPKTSEELKAEADATFLDAIEKGDAVAFYSLLESNADVNAKNENGTTALMVAANNERPEFLKALISRGADVNAKNNFGNTALMNAASFGQVEMVRDLLIAGANVKAKNESGWTALKLALKSAHAREENYRQVIELLRAYGAKK
jgi:uncharacterized protein